MALTKVKSEQLDAAQTSITSVGTLTGLTVSGDLTVDTSTLVVDSTNNNVGIGTTATTGFSSHTNIFLGGTGNIYAESSAGADSSLSISQNAFIDSDGSWEYIVTDEASNYYQNAGNHVWRYAASGTAGTDISWSEAMRINSSGNLLVGKTTQNLATEGISINPLGYIQVTENQSPTLYLNRLGTDGSIINFYKDGSTVGTIGTRGNDVYLETGDTGIRMYDQSDAIIPVGSTGVSRDGAIDLGISNIRFKDLYLSGVARLGTSTTYGTIEGKANSDLEIIANAGQVNGNPNIIFKSSNAGSAVAERMRIDSSGELTLGNSSAGSALQLDVSATGSDGVDIKSSYYTGSYGPMKFHTGGSERMRIDQNGTLLLTTPAGGAYGYLNVKEAGNGDVRFGMESGINYDAIAGTFTNNSMKFYTNSTERMQVLSSGDVGYSGKLFSSNVPGTLGGLQLYRNHANGECFLFDTTPAGPYDGPLIFGTSNTEAMRIKEGTGFVGIGAGTATNPRYNLTVAGNNSTAIGIGVDNANGSSTLDIAALGTGYNLHQAAAGEVWFYSPDNINIGGATGNTNDIKFIANNSINMRIRSSGVVTAPSQTYVQGRGSSGWSSFTQSWNIQPMGTPSLSVNRGTAYNTTTKRFTAPVDGVYLVIGSWYIYHPAASSRAGQYVHPAITVNGSLVWNGGQQPYTIFGHNNSDGSTTHMDGVNIAFTVYLSADDYVRQEVYSYSTNTQTYDLYHYFSYMLLH